MLNPLVSIIIPNYNYSMFIIDAIRSVQAQTLNNLECIIVDDGSTDNSIEVIENTIKGDKRFRLIKQSNQGVAQARNNGIKEAKSEFICPLDADDQIMPDFLEVCVTELEKDRSLGIVYTRLQTDNGYVSSWPSEFNYHLHIEGQNQIPTCCVMRKDAWLRAGGYRKRYEPSEDADLWTRITTFGYNAKKVSDQPLFIYRYHDKSLSAPYRDGYKPLPNWHMDKGYLKWLPFAAPGAKISYPVRNYDRPDVSVIIPVGKGHEQLVRDAIDSVEQQTFWNWECIVINNTGQDLSDLLVAYPFIHLYDCSGGAAHARNKGLDKAKAPLTLFLDADDYLFPEFLSKTIRAYKESGRYIYTDWIKLQHGEKTAHTTPDFNETQAFKSGSFHAITALVPTKEARLVRFNEDLSSWEDAQFFLDLIAYGICGKRFPEPLFVYRMDTGSMREKGINDVDELKSIFAKRYRGYIDGGIKVACSCQHKTKVIAENELPDLVKVVYNGAIGRHEVIGQFSHTRYGRRQGGDTFYIKKIDLQMIVPYNMSPLFTPIEEIELPREDQAIPADL